MTRTILAYVLIVIGLSGVASGAAMAYIFSIGNSSALRSAEVEARMNPNAPNFGPRRNPDLMWQYGSAALSFVVGSTVAYAGFRLRTPMPRRTANNH
jgi:hypothetical protein